MRLIIATELMSIDIESSQTFASKHLPPKNRGVDMNP